jgi:hypothetical protein
VVQQHVPYQQRGRLSGPEVVASPGPPGTYTATTSVDVGPTPYYGTGTDLVAFVSLYSTSLPPTGAQASSNVLETGSSVTPR